MPERAGGTPPENHRRAGRCVVHDDLAWLYYDGDAQCMHQLVVESNGSDCVVDEIPAEWMIEGQEL